MIELLSQHFYLVYDLQRWPKKCVLGCVKSPPRSEAGSRNLGQLFFSISVHTRDLPLEGLVVGLLHGRVEVLPPVAEEGVVEERVLHARHHGHAVLSGRRHLDF